MTFGVKFLTNRGERQLHEGYMVPEFIGKVTLNPTPAVYARGGESGYVTYDYSGTVPNASGRAVMIFWTLPSTASDVWVWSKAYRAADAGAGLTGISIYHQSGVSVPELPEGYVFAVGRVLPSTEQYCMRIWNVSGELMFDSGRLHLNLETVLSGINLPTGSTSSAALTALSKPAFLVPHAYRMYVQLGDVVPGEGSSATIFRQWLGCMRRSGSTLYSRMVKVTDMKVPPGGGLSASEDQTYGNINGLAIPVINAAIYD